MLKGRLFAGGILPAFGIRSAVIQQSLIVVYFKFVDVLWSERLF